METKSTFLDWCKNHSKLIASLVTAIAAIIIALLTSSCGSVARASITNRAEGTTTEVKITTSNPTTISTNVNPDLKYNPKNN